MGETKIISRTIPTSTENYISLSHLSIQIGDEDPQLYEYLDGAGELLKLIASLIQGGWELCAKSGDDLDITYIFKKTN